MPSSVTVVAIRRDPNRIEVIFDDGSGVGAPSVQLLSDMVVNLDTNRDTAKALAIAWWLARSPDATNDNLLVGKTLTFNLSAANPIRVQ